MRGVSYRPMAEFCMAGLIMAGSMLACTLVTVGDPNSPATGSLSRTSEELPNEGLLGTQSFPATLTPSPSPTVAPSATAPAWGWKQGVVVLSARLGGRLGIYAIDLEGDGQLAVIVAPERNQAFRGSALSPDSGRVAYYLYGTRAEILDIATGTVVETRQDCNSPTWSPDGKKVVCGTSSGGGSTFLIVDAETGAALSVLDPQVSGAVIPAWSPTGAEVAFAALTQTYSSVWRSDWEGRTVELASEGSENYAPAWSPDGEWIAYQSRSGSTDSEIWVMDRDGGRKRRLTTTTAGWSRAPTWSPDGRWIAFVSSQAGSIGADYGELFAVSVESGEMVQLTRTDGQVYDWRPWWGQ